MHLRRVNNAFIMLVVRLLQGNTTIRILKEATTLIKKYESYLIQFPKFTYLRVVGLDGYPYRWLRYVDDNLFLIELCRQLMSVQKKCRYKKNKGVTFPICLSHYKCESISKAEDVERALDKIKLYTYQMRVPFDCKWYVKNNLRLGPGCLHFPNIEDF